MRPQSYPKKPSNYKQLSDVENRRNKILQVKVSQLVFQYQMVIT